jgi:hypothetical protein
MDGWLIFWFILCIIWWTAAGLALLFGLAVIGWTLVRCCFCHPSQAEQQTMLEAQSGYPLAYLDEIGTSANAGVPMTSINQVEGLKQAVPYTMQ